MTIIISLLFMVFVVVMELRAPTPLEFIGRLDEFSRAHWWHHRWTAAVTILFAIYLGA